MNPLEIFKSKHWCVTHRDESRYLGYSMVGYRGDENSLRLLPEAALSELGFMLARTHQLLTVMYKPHRVISSKLGFDENFSCHFHVIPIRYDLLDEVRKKQAIADPDGVDAFSYITRTYCGGTFNKSEAQEVHQEVKKLKELYQSMCES